MEDTKISGLTAGTPGTADTFPFQRGGTANYSATPAAIGVGAKTYFDTLFAPITGSTEYIAAVTPGASGNVLTSDGTDWTSAAPSGGGGGGASTPPGRLTLESGVPVSTTDQVDKTTLYYTPYVGNQIMLYDGSSAWETLSFSELSLNISAFTASKPYDIWAYNNSGTVTLDSTVWTNDTTRATALTYQDGRLVKTGATTRLYLGTIYIDAASKCQFKLSSPSNIGVWNYYNQVNVPVVVKETTDSWVYTTATFRSANNSTANRVQAVFGSSDSMIDMFVSGYTLNATPGAGRGVGIAIDATNVNDCEIKITTNLTSVGGPCYSIMKRNAPIGYHYFQWTEFSDAVGSTTWAGDYSVPNLVQTGIVGNIKA